LLYQLLLVRLRATINIWNEHTRMDSDIWREYRNVLHNLQGVIRRSHTVRTLGRHCWRPPSILILKLRRCQQCRRPQVYICRSTDVLVLMSRPVPYFSYWMENFQIRSSYSAKAWSSNNINLSLSVINTLNLEFFRILKGFHMYICYHFPPQVEPKRHINLTKFSIFTTFSRSCSEFVVHFFIQFCLSHAHYGCW
jgi:hypothetical protein